MASPSSAVGGAPAPSDRPPAPEANSTTLDELGGRLEKLGFDEDEAAEYMRRHMAARSGGL